MQIDECYQDSLVEAAMIDSFINHHIIENNDHFRSSHYRGS
jgi:hypothetical protein